MRRTGQEIQPGAAAGHSTPNRSDFLARPAFCQRGVCVDKLPKSPGPLFELMLLLGAATAFWSVIQRRFISFLPLAGYTRLAVLSIRNTPLFMIIAASPVGLALAEWLRYLKAETIGSPLHTCTRRRPIFKLNMIPGSIPSLWQPCETPTGYLPVTLGEAI
jgi:hypothetical protein